MIDYLLPLYPWINTENSNTCHYLDDQNSCINKDVKLKSKELFASMFLYQNASYFVPDYAKLLDIWVVWFPIPILSPLLNQSNLSSVIITWKTKRNSCVNNWYKFFQNWCIIINCIYNNCLYMGGKQAEPALRFVFLYVVTLWPLGVFFSNSVGVCNSPGFFFCFFSEYTAVTFRPIREVTWPKMSSFFLGGGGGG